MSWIVRMTPHYHVKFSCGHVLQCACSNRRGKRSTVSEEMCPKCYVGLVGDD